MKKILLFLSLITAFFIFACFSECYATEVAEEIEATEQEVEDEIVVEESKEITEEEKIGEENNNIEEENEIEEGGLAIENDEQTNALVGNVISYGTSSVADENQLIENGRYQIVSGLDENKVIDIQGPSTESGANVHLIENFNLDNQKFEVTYEDGYYTIESVYSGKVLDVYGGRTANKTNVWQYESNGTDAQKWMIKDAGDGYYNIISKCNNLCLDLEYGLTANGTNIQVYEANGTGAQKFKFIRLASENGTQIIEDGYYQIASSVDESKVLNIEVPYNTKGSNIVLSDNLDQTNQVFNVVYNGDGTYTLKSLSNNNVIDVYGGRTANKTNVWQWESNDTKAQKWVIKDAGNGFYNIISKCNDLYLDLAYGSSANGSNIQVYKGNGTAAQNFKFIKYEFKDPERTIEDGRYQIVSSKDENKLVDIAGPSKESGANVHLIENFNLDNQKFLVTYEDGYYTIESIYSGKVLDVQDGKTENKTNVRQYNSNGSDAQKWIIKDAGDGSYFIISKCNNLCLDLEYGLTANSTNIQVYEENGTAAQKFKFVRLEGDNGTKTIEDGMYQIVSSIDDSKVLTIEAPYNVSGANVIIYNNREQNSQIFDVIYNGNGTYSIKAICSNNRLAVEGAGKSLKTNIYQEGQKESDSQMWIIKDAGDGYFYIISKCNDLYLDLAYGSTANGTNVQMYKGNGTQAQKFTFVNYLLKEIGQTIEDGEYQIVSALDNKKIITVENKAQDSGSNVYIYENRSLTRQIFSVTYEDGFYTIKSVNTDNVLDVQDAGTANKTNVQLLESNGQDEQKWIIKYAGDGCYFIISKCNNLCIDIEYGSSNNCSNIQVYEENGTLAQKFKFRRPTTASITHGIDVSEWNKTINWTEVARTEDFAIIRVGYRGYRNPRLVLDSTFTQNIEGALNAGMEVGAYFFTTAVNIAEAIEEANWTADRLEGYNVTYPVAVDVEWTNGNHDGRSDYLGKEDRTIIVKAFCETIKARGYTPMIYASKSWLNTYLDMSQLQEYDIWLAHYTWSESKPSDYAGDYTMWQYSSIESVNGIVGNVDKNVCYYSF